MANRAKAFEKRLASDWERTVQDSLCYRLLDVMSGYKAISNAGDYICFKSPSCFIIDCKSTEQNKPSWENEASAIVSLFSKM